MFRLTRDLLVSCSSDRSVYLSRVSHKTCINTFVGHSSLVTSAAFSPHDSTLLASASLDRTVRVWRRLDDDYSFVILHGHTDGVMSVCFSPHSNGVIASASLDKTVRLWNCASGEVLSTFVGHTDGVLAVCFPPKEKDVLVSGGKDQTIRVWQVSTMECLLSLSHSGSVESLSFSCLEDTLASASLDKTVRIWRMAIADAPEGLSRVCVAGCVGNIAHPWPVYVVRWSPYDDRVVATGTEDAVVRLWLWTSSQCIFALRGHTDRVLSLSFSPYDEDCVMSGGGDGTVRVWTLSSQTAHVLSQSNYSVNALAVPLVEALSMTDKLYQ